MSDDEPQDKTSEVDSAFDAAGELARKHGISPDRAQMLIDRLGVDSVRLDDAAEALRINPRGDKVGVKNIDNG